MKLDVWNDISTSHIEKLYNDPRYPEHPTYTGQLSTYDYNGIGTKYGSRLSAVYEVKLCMVIIK